MLTLRGSLIELDFWDSVMWNSSASDTFIPLEHWILTCCISDEEAALAFKFAELPP
jgi:hypothetical protein